MVLRRATLEDVALLRRWDQQPHVRAATGADGDEGWSWETEIASASPHQEQLIAELDGRPIGVIQIIDPEKEETHYWGESEPDLRAIDIWIGEASDLGHGYGSEMMRLALARCFAPPEVTAVVIDPLASNVRAIRFYERMGFERVGPRRFGEDECLVMRIGREWWNREVPHPGRG